MKSEKKLPIWGENIPGNSAGSKYEDMEIDRTVEDKKQALIQFVKAIVMDVYSDEKQTIDTFTWIMEIREGHAVETYEDVPFLVPFLAEGSRKAVIVVPGGGFAYLSTDADPEGWQGEGDLVAKALNEAGISAFVLWYRFNPYRQPIPLLDLQRAVRFLRCHAEEYGIDSNQIGAVGFSAGGYLVAGMQNLAEGRNLFPTGYEPDEVDRQSGRLDFSAMVYPALRYQANSSGMFVSFTAGQVRDEACRRELEKEYDCLARFRPGKNPVFISYGTDDHMVSTEDILKYTELLKQAGQKVTVVPVEGADHGFGVEPAAMKKYGYWLKKFTNWCKGI